VPWNSVLENGGGATRDSDCAGGRVGAEGAQRRFGPPDRRGGPRCCGTDMQIGGRGGKSPPRAGDPRDWRHVRHCGTVGPCLPPPQRAGGGRGGADRLAASRPEARAGDCSISKTNQQNQKWEELEHTEFESIPFFRLEAFQSADPSAHVDSFRIAPIAPFAMASKAELVDAEEDEWQGQGTDCKGKFFDGFIMASKAEPVDAPHHHGLPGFFWEAATASNPTLIDWSKVKEGDVADYIEKLDKRLQNSQQLQSAVGLPHSFGPEKHLHSLVGRMSALRCSRVHLHSDEFIAFADLQMHSDECILHSEYRLDQADERIAMLERSLNGMAMMAFKGGKGAEKGTDCKGKGPRQPAEPPPHIACRASTTEREVEGQIAKWWAARGEKGRAGYENPSTTWHKDLVSKVLARDEYSSTTYPKPEPWNSAMPAPPQPEACQSQASNAKLEEDVVMGAGKGQRMIEYRLDQAEERIAMLERSLNGMAMMAFKGGKGAEKGTDCKGKGPRRRPAPYPSAPWLESSTLVKQRLS
jgi:ubiquitin